MKLFAALPLAVLFTSTAFAADLIIDTPATSPIKNHQFYFQALAGLAAEGPQDWADSDDDAGTWDAASGYAVAVALGYQITDELSAEIDLLHSKREFIGDDNYTALTSLMANAKYSVSLSDAAALYGAVGVGYVWEDFSGADFGGFGYQLIAGASYRLADNVSLVGEYRFQNTFSPMENDELADWTHQLPTHHVLVGLKFDF